MNTLFAKWSRAAALIAGMATLGACVKYDDKISVGPGSGSENYAIWIQLGSCPTPHSIWWARKTSRAS